jgi:hypothetical protein
MAGAGIQSLAKFRAQISAADCHEENNHRADCHSHKSKFESGLPQAWSDRMYQYSGQPERGAWWFAVHMRAVCQEVIAVVAIRSIIWLRNLTNDRIPVPAILHRPFPCLIRHSFLALEFLGVRQIRGGLFRPKLYTNGLSWRPSGDTIPLSQVTLV